MREIKFRQYLGNGDWHFWGVNPDPGVVFRMPRMKLESQQYTGLKDKNGKEIYEGDILQYKNIPMFDEPVETWVEEVGFEDGCFITCYPITKKGNCPLYAIFDCELFKDIEVIGNIYEHPHLLGKE